MVEKKQGPVVEKHCYNKFLMKFIFVKKMMKTRENTRMVKLESLQNFPFMDIY
jgi:hypothetical protein